MIHYTGKNYMYEYTYIIHPFGSKLARAVSIQYLISLEAFGMCFFLKKLSSEPLHILPSSMLHFLSLLGLRLHALVFQQFLGICTSLHLGWHAHRGNGSAGKSNHTTTSPETCADCLKIVLGLTECMGKAGRCAAHNAPTSEVPVAIQTSRCAAHKAPANQAPVATCGQKTGQTC